MARLHMDTLATTTTTGREVREALSNLPRDTSDIYDKTMERVDGQPVAYRKLARLAFIWIICAYRQLSFEELQHAIAISSDLEMTELDSSALVDETILTKACAGLVVVDRSGTVHLARKNSPFNTDVCNAYSFQTTPHRSISSAKELLDFQMRRLPSRKHASHISHWTYSRGTILTRRYIFSWDTMVYSDMPLGTGATMHVVRLS